jgi:hypothetical protein
MLKESFVYELEHSVNNKAKGLSVFSAIVFIIGELAGSGVLALPNALASSGNYFNRYSTFIFINFLMCSKFFSLVMILFMST